MHRDRVTDFRLQYLQVMSRNDGLPLADYILLFKQPADAQLQLLGRVYSVDRC